MGSVDKNLQREKSGFGLIDRIGRILSPGGRTAIGRTQLLLPSDLQLDEWKEIGTELLAISEASTWWLGDWLVYGQNRYPERYQQAIGETGLDYQTLRNYAWVARKFAVSERHPKLSLQHHAEVAVLSPESREAWLGRAERFGWSRNKLRHHLKASRAGSAGLETNGKLFRIVVDQSRAGRWRLAAEAAGHSLDDWAAAALDQAAADDPHISVLAVAPGPSRPAGETRSLLHVPAAPRQSRLSGKPAIARN